MAALKHQQPLTCWGLGGDQMIAEGLEALYHVRDLSVTGFVEVLKHLRFFRHVMHDILQRCREDPPDAAILLDYPGFNLRLGLQLKKLNIPVFYYISPQVWAWKQGRVKTMRRFIRRIFVIFPFEVPFYEAQDIPVSFFGHPLVEQTFELGVRDSFFASQNLDPDRPLLAILPGSRRNELQRHVHPLAGTIKELHKRKPDLQFAIAGLSGLDHHYYQELLDTGLTTLVLDKPYVLTAHADAAIVASGTASLETAYLGTPLVVIYRIAPLSYLIGKLLVTIDHLAMPNLILGERAIPELIQGDANVTAIANAVEELLVDQRVRATMLEKLVRLKVLLGQAGCAEQIAEQIFADLELR